MKFYYEGHTAHADPCCGEIHADTEAAAVEKLRGNGIYVLQLSEEQITPKYTSGALATGPTGPTGPIGGPQLDSETAGDAQARKAPEPISKVADVIGNSAPGLEKKAKKRPVKRTNSHKDEEVRKEARDREAAAWQSSLAREVQGISDVVRMVDAWHKAYQAGAKLPPGCPNVGGKTWEIYGSKKEEIVHEMFAKAMCRAVQKAPLGLIDR